jgi:hypothetical protein
MATAKYGITFMDYDRELSTFKLNVPQLDAVTVLTIGASAAAFRAAVAGISGATFKSERFTQFDNQLSNVPPTNQYYQRETKYLVLYQDNVTLDIFRCEVPCANLSLLANHSEFLDITTALSPGKVFKDDFEGFVVSEEGNPITVLSVQAVGRDL